MRNAFTLIELLVVITIIVVLLALLTPALDRTIYQAELAACAAQQKTIGQAGVTYCFDHQRRYPHRPGVDNADSNWQALTLYQHPGAWGPYDDRPILRPYMNINGLLNDPLVGAVDLENTDDLLSDVMSSINMWFGFRYRGERGLHRFGDRWTFGNNSFDLLVSDRDVVGGAGDPTLRTAGVRGGGDQCSHPDAAGVMTNEPFQDGQHPWGGPNIQLTMSLWLNLGTGPRRGEVDTNATSQDLSVERFNAVQRNRWGDQTIEPRMVLIYTFNGKSGGPLQVPR